MHYKEITIKYLNRQLETYLSAKEFAIFKINRLEQQNGFFSNPTITTELSEFEAQKERCETGISEILACIDWLKRMKVAELTPKSN